MKFNRLINQTSPYLLQHARNPVDWYPWCEEAFTKAKLEDKPVLVSIGYSTCHWCHVMAKEAFSDIEIAEYLNENFISIKVDKEERPDIDAMYMNACQLIKGNCGWPLNIMLTPEKKPFFAGTYFPIESRYNIPGFLDLLKNTVEIWQNKRETLIDTAQLVTEKIYNLNKSGDKEQINSDIFDSVFTQLKESFDPIYSGFSYEPKFAQPLFLNFLLRYYKKFNDELALDMVEKTLSAIYRGGIFDHAHGGFHRYAVDRKWTIPHFEKMLYDQALITNVYLETYQITKEPFYLEVATKTLDYVLDELLDEDGGFYSAVDADSECKEGKYYTWKMDDIIRVLGEDAELFAEVYGVKQDGNFEGRNVLYLANGLQKVSKKRNIEIDTLNNFVDHCLMRLRCERLRQVHPDIDDKILTAWNGLMIKSFALAGRILNNNKYKNAAKNAAEFVIKNLKDDNNKLSRSYRHSKASVSGFLEDYSFFVNGLIELYEATYEIKYLNEAILLNNVMIDEFYDEKINNFRFSKLSETDLLVNITNSYDDVTPSGTSVAINNLLILSDICENTHYKKLAVDVFEAMGDKINSHPVSYINYLADKMYLEGRHRVVLLSGAINNENTKDVLNFLNNEALFDGVILFKKFDDDQIDKIHRSAKDKTANDKETEVYLCEESGCKPPTSDLMKLRKMFKSI